MKTGEILEVLVDHEDALESVPKFVKNKKQKHLSTEPFEDGSSWKMYFQKV
jgi:TusA-related sulfurtransferase